MASKPHSARFHDYTVRTDWFAIACSLIGAVMAFTYGVAVYHDLIAAPETQTFSCVRADNVCELHDARGESAVDTPERWQLDQIESLTLENYTYRNDWYPTHWLRIRSKKSSGAVWSGGRVTPATKSDVSFAEMTRASSEVAIFLAGSAPTLTTAWTIHATVGTTLNDMFMLFTGAVLGFVFFGMYRTKPSAAP